jgi:hypothetical protein
MNFVRRVFRNGQSVPALPPPEPKRSVVMSLHDTLVRLASFDDDATAEVIAIALQADYDIRTRCGAPIVWDREAVKRVARALADHAGMASLIPRQAAAEAVARAVNEQASIGAEAVARAVNEQAAAAE